MYSHTTTLTTPAKKTSYSNNGVKKIQLTVACTKCDQMAVREETAKWMRRRIGKSSCVAYSLHLMVAIHLHITHIKHGTLHMIARQHQSKSMEASKAMA